MKTLLVTGILLVGFGAQAADTFQELYKISCVAYEDVNDDPSYSFAFARDDDDNTSVMVKIEERVKSRIFKDTYWVPVYEASEQSTSNSKQFLVGIDDVAIVIQKDTMKNSRGKANGRVEFRIGRSNKQLDLFCDQE